MSALFWFITGASAGVAGTAAIVALWRNTGAQPQRRAMRIAVTAGAACAFAAIATIAYLTSGSPQSPGRAETAATPVDRPAPEVASPTGASPTGKVPSMEEATARLEARLSQGGGSPQDWQLLVQSYEFMGRTADAQRARAHVIGSGATQLSGISDATLAAGAAIMQESSLAAPSAASAATPEASESHGAYGSGISGTVSVEAQLASTIKPGAILFIYAKAADSPGPPLAVVRVAANTWPVPFHLDDSMAMLPARRLSQFPRVVVEARVSRTGQAAPGPGDLYVTSDVLSPGEARQLALVITHQIG